MTNPVQPLTPEQVTQVMADASRHSYLWKLLLPLDEEFNVAVTDGSPTETFSSHCARLATEEPEGSVKQRVGAAVCAALNAIHNGHAAEAELADLARNQQTVAAEQAAPTVQQEGQITC